MQLQFFGRPKVSRDGGEVRGFRSTKTIALLCYLAVTGRPHTRAHLASLLWEDMPETHAGMNLRKTLMNLRQLLGVYISSTRQEIALNRALPYQMDVGAFETGISFLTVNQALSKATVDQLAEAIELYQAAFLEGFYVNDAPQFEEWALAQRAHLHDLLVNALRAAANYYASQQNYLSSLEYIRRLLIFDPLDEDGHYRLMAMLAQSGQRTTALNQYKLFRKHLADDLGVEPAADTTALYNSIVSGDLQILPEHDTQSHSTLPDAPAVRVSPIATSAASESHNLPQFSTPFVGRSDELRALADLITNPECRLLTLLGLGGIGKTRLAVQAVREFLDGRNNVFVNRVAFIATASISSSDSLVAALAEALGWTFYGDTPARIQLLDYLREKRVLLVLDSFEHLLEDADLVTAILRIAPGVKILVTSREALRLQEEWVYLISGLKFPQGTDSATATPDAYDAVRLFVQNATRARVGFSLVKEQEHAIRICQLLEGMPLAIELATAWLSTFSCAHIAQQIEQGTDLLVAVLRNVPERHRSIRAVFEHSWELLPAMSRTVLMRLSVFRGGFTPEAASQVADASQPVLLDLATRSLIQITPSNRYQMHELLRQFAADKLQGDKPEQAATESRHCRHYLGFLQKCTETIGGKHQQETLKTIGVDMDNIRLAWNDALRDRTLTWIGQAIESLSTFYQISSRFVEGMEVFGVAIEYLQGDFSARQITDKQTTSVWGRLLSRQAAFCIPLGRYQEADLLTQQSLEIARALDDKTEIVCCLDVMGTLAYWQGQPTRAKKLHRESLAICREIGDRVRMVKVLNALGETSEHLGEWDEEREFILESLAISQGIGADNTIANVLDKLGAISFYKGEYEASTRYYRESYAMFDQSGDRLGKALTLGGLGWSAWVKGEAHLAEAYQLLEQSLALCREIGHQPHVASRLVNLATVANSTGEYDRSERYSQEALTIARRLSTPMYLTLALSELAGAASGLGDFTASRAYLMEALAIASKSHIRPFLLQAMFRYAELLIKEEQANQPSGFTRSSSIDHAALLLKLVAFHPASWRILQDAAQRLLKTLEDNYLLDGFQLPTITLENAVKNILEG